MLRSLPVIIVFNGYYSLLCCVCISFSARCAPFFRYRNSGKFFLAVLDQLVIWTRIHATFVNYSSRTSWNEVLMRMADVINELYLSSYTKPTLTYDWIRIEEKSVQRSRSSCMRKTVLRTNCFRSNASQSNYLGINKLTHNYLLKSPKKLKLVVKALLFGWIKALAIIRLEMRANAAEFLYL